MDAIICWWEDDSGLQLRAWCLIMQWYRRTPARMPTRRPAMKTTTAVVETAIHIAGSVVERSTAPEGEGTTPLATK